MRRVVVQMGVTLDGYVAGPGGEGDWGLPAEHPDVRAWKVASLRQAGTHIMGRITYEQMAEHWPNATGEYAESMNKLPKVVFSKTLPAAEWAGSRIARGDLTEEIAALKSESGGEVMAHGGAAFVQALSRFGLIDEYRLIILPVALGSGLPLFKDLAKPLRVDLAEAKSFPDGTVIHVYTPITSPRLKIVRWGGLRRSRVVKAGVHHPLSRVALHTGDPAGLAQARRPSASTCPRTRSTRTCGTCSSSSASGPGRTGPAGDGIPAGHS